MGSTSPRTRHSIRKTEFSLVRLPHEHLYSVPLISPTGDVFHGIGRDFDFDLYPSIGLLRHGEVIRANFGQDPFKFDIDHVVQQQQTAMWSKILATPLDRTVLTGHRKTPVGSIASITNDTEEKPALSADEEREVLNKLVMSYLIHHGYIRTAKLFEKRKDALHKEDTPSSFKDMDVEMSNGASSSINGHGGGGIEARTQVVNAVLRRDVVSAIEGTRKHFPDVLEADGHLMFIKLRCRRFIELILETAEIKKKMKSLEKEVQPLARVDTGISSEAWDEEMSMDIDDDAPGPFMVASNNSNVGLNQESSGREMDGESYETAAARYETALNSAIAYGQELSDDAQADPRPEVQDLFKTTFGIVAWEDPLEAGSPIARLVGPESRFALANELNEAILSKFGNNSCELHNSFNTVSQSPKDILPGQPSKHCIVRRLRVSQNLPYKVSVRLPLQMCHESL